MTDEEVLNRINKAEADVWSVFAQHHEVEGHCLVYDVLSPTHLWSNAIYTPDVGHRFELVDANRLETFYQVHGLEGFLRDFHGDFKSKSLGTYTYMYFDPETSTALAFPPALTMHRCAAGELGAFAEAARLCYGRGTDFVFSFHQRMGRVLRRYTGSFFLFQKDGQTAAVVSLIHSAGLSRLMHLAVRPELRGRGYGAEILQTVVRHNPLPVFSATEIPQLSLRMFPAAGFRPVATFDTIPLYSLLR
ncbi:MAG: GNAT family N-acetyltransferase [Bdellovibrionales bacterium]|nr:GNAT family N-acetyltransferase [Bdellovibrionales bacterium]